ncbi:MAG: transketolase-like TK C-terminal-containing protein, partial [Puniceicoccales bacterium]
DETKAYFEQLKAERVKAYQAWEEKYKKWTTSVPEQAALLEKGINHEHMTAEEILAKIEPLDDSKPAATRATGGKILNEIAKHSKLIISGSADLHGSTKNYIDGVGDFDTDNFAGRNFHYGIREHGMGAIMNGIAYDGVFKTSGATFFTFSDYMRPSVRLAALAKLPVVYIWTHDSVGVGEDGPTHEPVETLTACRAIPNLHVLRPADGEETAAAWAHAVERADGPTALILSRQNLPFMSDVCVADRRAGTLKGAYIAKKEAGEDGPDIILIGTGSEVQHCIEAAKELETLPATHFGEGVHVSTGGESIKVRVVSMPSMELFDAQSDEYKESVLPASCQKRISIEAGITMPWWKYVGNEGKRLGIDRFGISAPGDTVMEELGMTPKAVVEAAKSL